MDCGLVNYADDDYVCELPEFTEIQWNNLVKVCEIIKDNAPLFDMSSYHRVNKCGTSHCIAGWAVAVEFNDDDVTQKDYTENRVITIAEKYGYNPDDLYSVTSSLASAILSPLMYPFFYLIGDGDDVANQIMMEKFIEPVLEIAKQTNCNLE